MQKPTLPGVQGQAQEILETYRAGFYFEPENEKDFIAKLMQLKNNTDLYSKCQEGCTRLAEDYDRKKLADKMLKIVEGVVV